MKLAYLGYDKTVFRTHPVLEQYFSAIDSYLITTDTEAKDLDFLNLPIMVDNVCIPADESLRTEQHKSVFKEIENEYNLLNKNIFSNYKLVDHEVSAAVVKFEKKLFNLNDIVSIKFDKVTKKYLIQTAGTGLIMYDYLIVQGHQLVTDLLQLKKQNIIHRSQIQTHLVLKLEFSSQYVPYKQHFDHDFILIENLLNKTIFDNWYICSISRDKVRADLFIPYSNYDVDEFIEFVANRTRNVLSDSFVSFKFGELLNSRISTCDGFSSRSLKLNNPKNSSVFPSFEYWSQKKINNYIQNLFNNKANKNLFLKKEII